MKAPNLPQQPPDAAGLPRLRETPLTVSARG